VNTTLKAYQDSKLAESYFRIELYFVETANQCD